MKKYLAFTLFVLPVFHAHAGVIPVTLQGHIRISGTPDFIFDTPSTKNMAFPPVLVSEDNAIARLKYASTPFTASTKLGERTIDVKDIKIPVSAARIGRAAGKLMRSLPYVATAITVGEIFCDLTNLCHLPNNPVVQKRIVSEGGDYDVQGFDAPSLTAACDMYFAYVSNSNPDFSQHHTSGTGSTGVCTVGTAWGYSTDHQATFTAGSPSTTYTPATEADWDSSYAFFDKGNYALSHMNIMAHFVFDNSGQLPVDTTDVPSQVFLIPSLDTVNRDSAGNPTGSTHTEDTLSVVNGSDPNTMQTTETVKTTNSDPSGNPVSSTTSTSTNPAGNTVKDTPDPPTISIDDVKDVDLPTYQSPSTFTTNSWGESSCPPDPILHTQLGNLTVPVSRVCYWVGVIRPAFILIAFILAGFIISGRKND